MISVFNSTNKLHVKGRSQNYVAFSSSVFPPNSSSKDLICSTVFDSAAIVDEDISSDNSKVKAISWMQEYVGDRIPNSDGEIFLDLCFTSTYDKYKEATQKLHGDSQILSLSQFNFMWDEEFNHVIPGKGI